MDKFIIILCDVSSGFSVPKINKIGQFLTELFLKNQGGPVFLAHPVSTGQETVAVLCPGKVTSQASQDLSYIHLQAERPKGGR